MSPSEFRTKWGPGGTCADLNERQGAQPHFIDLCRLLGVPEPGSVPGETYLFEKSTLLLGEARGYADVFYQGRFAWENKAPGRDLDAALRQLRNYSMALSNPPLLVVCDRTTIRIHTQFTGHPSETHTVHIDFIGDPAKQALLRRLWLDPESFRPRKTNRDITEAAAQSFAALADRLRARGVPADQVSHFLTQCLFCLFAEDVGLLPERMFERLVGNRMIDAKLVSRGLVNLFGTMREGGLYGSDSLPWFNGGLFETVNVPTLEHADVTELRNATALNWSAIDVSIFGTLFERGLDPAKRSQLGAHYTDPATIARLIEPVIQRPLLQQWEHVFEQIRGLRAKSVKHGDKHDKAARNAFITWLEQLREYRVLDPACGSGNFLFLGLKALKDIEHLSHTQASELGLDRETDLVTGPHNVLGIELNEYAAELARVSIWIGELQWRLHHGYPFKTNPVLEPLDHIECRDALLTWVGEGDARHAAEAPWPQASVVVGNPPFIGDKWMRSELGDATVDALRRVYEGRVPGGADLVAYWFEKARSSIESQGLGAAGLVATNSIRQRGNRPVLERIASTTRIFEAWADEPWVNDGAAVRVSLVCFGHATQGARLDGQPVQRIYTDLKAQAEGSEAFDLTLAQPLADNANASYFGFCLAGAFKVPAATAAQWLRLPNVNGRPNSDVLAPIYNGRDVTTRWAGDWVVDFGTGLDATQAAQYEAPFTHVAREVQPVRASNKRAARARQWWRFGETRPGLRQQLAALPRYIATVETAKHRVFVFFPVSVAPEHKLVVIARADDTTFGILSSRFHVVWALAQGGTLEDRPVYTTAQTFETFPFPAHLTPADTAHQRTEALASGALIPAGLAADRTLVIKENGDTALAGIEKLATETGAMRQHAESIAEAAHRLDTLRQHWLNPPEWTQRVPEVAPLGLDCSPYPDRTEPRPGISEADAKALQKRTLTNLYNQRPAWLAQAHEALDAAVAAAYGWADYTPAMPDDEILRRLLALNLARAKAQA